MPSPPDWLFLSKLRRPVLQRFDLPVLPVQRLPPAGGKQFRGSAGFVVDHAGIATDGHGTNGMPMNRGTRCPFIKLWQGSFLRILGDEASVSGRQRFLTPFVVKSPVSELETGHPWAHFSKPGSTALTVGR